MVLVTFVISYDDIVTTGGVVSPAYPSGGSTITYAVSTTSSYTNKATVLRNCNLNAGMYRATIEGIQVISGSVNTTNYVFAPQLINISSSAFQFPGNAVQGLTFTNNNTYTHADVGGQREFLVNVGVGNIDLTIYIAQFGTGAAGSIVPPYNLNKAYTWADSQFGYFVLSLNLENCDNKALFGDAK